jgi:hypothetical protein
VVLSGQLNAEAIVYSVVEPMDAPWSDFGAFGTVIDRPRALAEAEAADLFNVVDSIVANERRLSSRILSAGLQA